MTTSSSWVEIGRNPKLATTRDDPTNIHTLRVDTTSGASGGTNADAVATASSGVVPTQSFGYIWNGVTWDRIREAGNDTLLTGVMATAHMGWNSRISAFERVRNNIDTAALVSLAAVGASTVDSADQVNYNGRGANIVVDITALGVATTVTVNVQVKDVASGKYVTILASSALASTGTTLLTIYPGATVTSNLSASLPLSRTWRVEAIVGGSNTATATIAASVIL